MIAVMADQLIGSAMKGKRDVAVPAFQCFAAGPAEHELRESATIEENDSLLATLKSLRYCIKQFRRQRHIFTGPFEYLAHVDEFRSCQAAAADPVREMQVGVFACLRVI